LLQTIIDSIPAPLFFKDQEGRYRGCNKAFEEAMGLPRERITGKTVYDVAPSELAEVYHRADLELMARQGTQVYETTVLFADGRKRDIMFHKAVYPDETGVAAGLVGTMLDITDRKRSEEDVREKEERYRAFIAMSTEGIWRGDVEPPVSMELPTDEQVDAFVEGIRIQEANDAMARIYGFTQGEALVGRRVREFYDLADLREVLKAFVANDYRLNELEVRQFDRSGQEIWVATSVIGVRKDGCIHRLWGTRRDVTELKRHVQHLEHQANHDQLTGLPNRNFLQKRIGEVLENVGREGRRAALFIIDLDRFKELNDTLGHQAGDYVLCEIAGRLGRVVTGLGGEMARLGGDEFGLLFPEIRDERDASWLAEMVVQALQAPFDVEGLKVEIAASIGISLAPDHGNSTSKLLRCADVAMYQTKSAMGRFNIYDPGRDPYTHERLTLMAGLGGAIRNDELFLQFQPKVRLSDSSLTGFECLVRWQHPLHGLLMPGDFIPFAELGQLIAPLTYRILEKAISQLHSWNERGFRTTLACNLSPRLLMDEDLPIHLEAILSTWEVEPSQLELEITETALILEPERAGEILQRIHAMGVRLSIDDFGTGFSSLSLLKRLPLQALKIDLLFVSQMLQSEQDRIIVSSTIAMAKNLGLSVVAEGVENERTMAVLRDMGCDQAQGYHVARPMDEADIPGWLEEWSQPFALAPSAA
ncbi:MAG TPA: EAL domain-containing protein, partial [Geobacteraceae bacterium]